MADEFDMQQVSLIARLRLSEQEKQELERDLKEILASFSEISSAKGIDEEKEMHYPSKSGHKLREDRVEKCTSPDRILHGFARKDGRYMVAPKSLD